MSPAIAPGRLTMAPSKVFPNVRMNGMLTYFRFCVNTNACRAMKTASFPAVDDFCAGVNSLARAAPQPEPAGRANAEQRRAFVHTNETRWPSSSPCITQVVAGWPAVFEAQRATSPLARRT